MNVQMTDASVTNSNSGNTQNSVKESAVVSPTQEDTINNSNSNIRNSDGHPDTASTIMHVERIPGTTIAPINNTTTIIPLPPLPYHYERTAMNPNTSTVTSHPTPTPEILQSWIDVGNHIDKSQTGNVSILIVMICSVLWWHRSYSLTHKFYLLHSNMIGFLKMLIYFLLPKQQWFGRVR